MKFLELTVPEVEAALAAQGEPRYRARQLADWVYRKGVTDPAGMTNLPAALPRRFTYLTSRLVGRAESADGTLKLLVELADGERVETVLIPAERSATACLSTQVGCPVGCAFCASGLGGLKRNLSAGEILEQLLHLRQAGGTRQAAGKPPSAGGQARRGEKRGHSDFLWPRSAAHGASRRPENQNVPFFLPDRPITHVVFMGMGEPLANYAATVAAVRAIIDPRRFGLSARHVTVSTVGLPKAMRRLAAEGLPITLAVSLHAPDDGLRRRLVPGAAPVRNILAAAQAFFESRGREVTLEYVLLAGVNDTPACADRLADLAHRVRCSVNLIPYNPVAPLRGTRPAADFAPPSQAVVRAFAGHLRRRGANVHIRRSRGADAEAACGQLRRRASPPRQP